MSDRLTVVIDQGTHATRALAIDQQGRIRASAWQKVALHRLGREMVEQDAEEIVRSVLQVLKTVLADPEVVRMSIAQAGLATQRSTVVAWDRESGQPLAPALSWQDRRTAHWLQRLQPYQEEIKQRTGLPLSPHYGAGKLRWYLDHVSIVRQKLSGKRLAMGPLASFLLSRLLEGQPLVVDHANASRTQLWNIATCDWDPWLLDLFGVPEEALPHCRPISSLYGVLRGTDIPLLAVNGDQNAALYGWGQPRGDTAIVNLGTGAFVLLPTGNELIRHPRLLSGITNSSETERSYTLEGTVNGAGAALSWAAEQWQIPDLIARLPGWLAEENEPPIFLNSIGGLGSPWWQTGPVPAIVGEGSLGQKVVAVVESVLFLLQANIDAMAEAGLNIDRLQVSGGLARLDGLCQRLADLTGLPVYRSVETEATAKGIAWLAASGRGRWGASAAESVFSPRGNGALQDRYRQFCRLIVAE